jgi:transcriptional regulator with XRE-family HTH domain
MQNRIGWLRREKGMSLTALAKAAGTTKAQVQKLERGDRRLSLDWMDRIARALNVKVSDLLPPHMVACQHGPEDREILEIIAHLPSEDRTVLIRIANGLLNTKTQSDGIPSPREIETALKALEPPLLARRRTGET